MSRHILSNIDIENRTGTCSVCGEVKIVLSGIYPKGLPKFLCSIKRNTARVEEAKRNPERFRRNNDRHTAKRLNLSLEEYYQLREINSCQICGKKRGSINLPIDHCHTTGKIRGVLCNKCNFGLGYFDDSVEKLNMAIEYLLEIETPAK
jgi:hypothetical protein